MGGWGGIGKGVNVWVQSPAEDDGGGAPCPDSGTGNAGEVVLWISHDMAAEGLLCEWVDCSNGNKTEYKDGSLKGWCFM